MLSYSPFQNFARARMIGEEEIYIYLYSLILFAVRGAFRSAV